jgi:hypothetical protein
VNRRIRQHRRRSLDRRAARFCIRGAPAISDTAANPTKRPPTNRWEHRYLGAERFPETLSALEIEHFFTLDEDELVSIRERRGPLNRLALALLYPRVGFIVTSLARPAERVVAFYNQRGTAEQWIKEGKSAIRWTQLSCRTFAATRFAFSSTRSPTTWATSRARWRCPGRRSRGR